MTLSTIQRNPRQVADLNDPAAYDYDLPQELIAFTPAEVRDESSLMVCARSGSRTIPFSGIEELLDSGDVLVLNDTRVSPCRLMCRKATGGRVEVFVLEPGSGGRFRALTRANRSLSEGQILEVPGPEVIKLRLERRDAEGTWTLSIIDDGEGGSGGLHRLLERAGEMPLPPYIVRRRQAIQDGTSYATLDRERYQTVYAKHEGAVAAPTAGLHFTEELLGRISDKGVQPTFVTLHVGMGTFKPLLEEPLDAQTLHRESYVVSPEAVDAISSARAGGGRVIAVGTTCARVLEDQGARGGLRPGSFDTDIFIKPGHRWTMVDALLTNFHLPKSSLLVLVSSFMGYGETMAAYRQAASAGMRFYSYGDAMLAYRGGDR